MFGDYFRERRRWGGTDLRRFDLSTGEGLGRLKGAEEQN